MILGGRRRAIGAAVTVVAALALALAVTGRGCSSSDDSPEGTVRAFVTAARAGDKQTVWALLAPTSRARVQEAATAATEKVGGARRYGPLDVLEIEAGTTTYAPSTIVLREQEGDRAVVDVLGPDGRRDSVQVVQIDGRWQVELDLSAPRAN